MSYSERQPQTIIYETQPAQVTLSPPVIIENRGGSEYEPQSNSLMVRVRIPQGIKPGQNFVFKALGNRMYKVACPSEVSPGEEILVRIPSINEDVDIPQLVLPSIPSYVQAILTKDHLFERIHLC